MFDKFSVKNIVANHFGTFVDFQTKQKRIRERAAYLITPLIISLLLFFGLDFWITESASNVLITAMSIFSALLFNLLLLVYDVVNRNDGDRGPKNIIELKAILLRETFHNISFSILLTVVAVIVLLFTYVPIPAEAAILPIKTLLSISIYYLVGLFMLTLLMVLKRIHSLLTEEMNGK